MDDQTTANDECGICLEALTSAVTLPCTHKFCADCLDGWKSKFGSHHLNKEEKGKSCPLCRKKIPPSKGMLSQLRSHRKHKRDLEAKGDTTSRLYMNNLETIKRLEKEFGDYEGEGLDYDGKQCIELPLYIHEAVETNDIKRVTDWLGSPVDKDRLNARDPDRLNATLLHLAVATSNSDLLSILLQYGADVNALNANGWNPLLILTASHDGFEQAKILLEWGVEIILPRALWHRRGKNESNRDAFIQFTMGFGNDKMAKLISSEFGGRRCEVINLPKHPQLNGKTCVVEKYIAKKGRYKVIFEGSGNAALVGPNNLKRRDRTPLDCGYYISLKNGKIFRREFATKEECQEHIASLTLGGDVEETTEELASLKV